MTRRILCLLLISIVVFSCCERKSGKRSVSPYDYHVQVVGITDGDTFKGLTQDNIEIRFRIYGIDAPERKQAFSEKPRQYLSDLIYDKRVGIIVQKKSDRYGRPVVWVYTPDCKDVSAEMLKAGIAWHYKQYDKSEEYEELENRARKKRIGLWADKEPVTPWEFRK